MTEKYCETSITADDKLLSKIFIHENSWDNNFEIAMIANGGLVTNIEFQKHQQGLPITPFITLHKQTMQTLFNRMWELGFRPKDGTGNSGHIEALKYHLEDMRKLVFKEIP